MDCLRIIGGRPLSGTVVASGSKNASLPIIAASLLGDGPTVLEHVPAVTDVATLLEVVAALGVSSCTLPDGRLLLEPTHPPRTTAPTRLVRRMRASICVLGPLVARRGKAVVALPGGCAIGQRPIDLHLSGLETLGASIRVENDRVIAKAKRLRGATIDWRHVRIPTVTGTANVMCAATLARGKTVIRNAAREPEIVDLGRFLFAMGAKIEGLGTSDVEVVGQESLSGADHTVIPDRIEAATLLIAGAMTGGHVRVRGARDVHLSAVIELLTRAGCRLDISVDSVTIQRTGRLRAVDVTAGPFPNIPTDLQAPLMTLMARAQGRCLIADRVFPQRFAHVQQLLRFGADLTESSTAVFVGGDQRFVGSRVIGGDLRGTAALVVAGLAAEGETIVRGVRHLDRGYERLEEKLQQLGASITRLQSTPAASRVLPANR